MVSQKNEKSTQLYSTKSWIRSLAITVGVGKVCYKREQSQKSQQVHLRCISKGMVPVSVKLRSTDSIISYGARKIIQRAGKQLLQDSIKSINIILWDNEVKLDRCKSRLLSLVTTTTSRDRCTEFINKVRETRFIKVKNNQWDNEVKLDRCRSRLLSLGTTTTSRDRCTEFINKVRETRFIKVKNNLLNKFNRLVAKSGREIGGRKISIQNVNNSNQLQRSCKTYNSWLINLSNTSLTPARVSLITKGPNFAIAPPQPPQSRLYFSNWVSLSQAYRTRCRGT